MKLSEPEVQTFSSDELEKNADGSVSEALEVGNVVQFPEPDLQLPSEEDLEFLRNEIEEKITRKNVTYYPELGYLKGLENHPEEEERTHRILTDHMERVESFLNEVMPEMMEGVKRHKVDYRPKQEQQRDIDVRASSERIHVDAGAYWATHGDRILRFFVNLNPEEDRIWCVKGRLPDLAEKYHDEIFPDGNGASVRESMLDRVYTGIVDGLSTLIPPAKSIDTSPYDRAMRRLHNFMKESDEFQEEDEGKRTISFEPMSAFMVFTDMVGHSCIKGQYAICDTFIIPKENCQNEEMTPFNVLNQRQEN